MSFPINVFYVFIVEFFFFLRKHRRMTDVYTRHIQTQIPTGRTRTWLRWTITFWGTLHQTEILVLDFLASQQNERGRPPSQTPCLPPNLYTTGVRPIQQSHSMQSTIESATYRGCEFRTTPLEAMARKLQTTAHLWG